ncbi:hypothetical protein BC834DRAFT_632395 [Gloeopeniophorella convolvens]|nr:hypothetical protein BC834DRAFT_632395 [Gloeopeniophorella convolvens]
MQRVSSCHARRPCVRFVVTDPLFMDTAKSAGRRCGFTGRHRNAEPPYNATVSGHVGEGLGTSSVGLPCLRLGTGDGYRLNDSRRRSFTLTASPCEGSRASQLVNKWVRSRAHSGNGLDTLSTITHRKHGCPGNQRIRSSPAAPLRSLNVLELSSNQ